MILPHTHQKQQERPPWEVADVFDRYFDEYRATHGVSCQQLKVVGEVKERVSERFRRCPVCEVERMCFQRLVEPQELPAYRLMLAGGRACFDTS